MATSAPCFDGAAHQRPLLAIALAAGAEHANQPPGGHLPQRLQHAGQRVGRVGEIDKHAERLAALDPFQPARHVADRFQPANDRGQFDAVGQSDGGRRQAVVDVVRADHLRSHRHGLAAGGQQEGLFAHALLRPAWR